MSEGARWDPITDITDANPRQLRFIVDQALCPLAADLKDVLEPILRELGGLMPDRSASRSVLRHQ